MLLSRRSIAAVLVALATTAFQVGSAQEPQPQEQTQTPTFREEINFVRVDVIVSDGKQQPVMDLTLADFEVLEDDKPQKVEQFRLIKIDGNVRPGEPPPREIRNRNDEEAEAAKEDVRLFLFFFGVAEAFAKKRVAGPNPWGAGATTLEWTLPSPPPFHQFNELPVVHADAQH